MSRLIPLFRPGGLAMSCPPDPLLLLRGAGDLPPDLADGWTQEALSEHVARCRACRRHLRRWRRAVDTFRSLDVIDKAPYDDAFFDQLAREVDEALGRDPAPVVTLRPARRGPPMLWAAAALLALAALVGFLLPPEAPEPQAEGTAPPDDALLLDGRALGRQWLQDALDEDDAGLLAWTDDSALDDDGYPFATTLYDELDELDRADLDALFTRL